MRGNEGKLMIDEQRVQLALQTFNKYPDKFSEETKREILDQKVSLGMTPFEAQLAGGSFTYKVKPDPRWHEDADPLRVIETQSVDPDDSEISLTFKNTTQFPGEEPTAFRADFNRGRVSNIVALN